MISSAWMRLKGPQGCQKMCHHPLNKLVEIWCAKVELIEGNFKYCQKTGIFDGVLSVLTVFSKFLRFFSAEYKGMSTS